MKDKNGFTLVELLAVIAILAILVIIALPNVMSLFNEAKKNSFTNEAKEIYKTAQQQWMNDSMLSTNEATYTRCETCTGKELPLSGRKEIDYYVKVNKAGKVVEFYVTDGTYQFSNDGELLITDINNIEQVANLTDNEKIRIENDNYVDNRPAKFILNGNAVEYEAGMTWEEFINSSYNETLNIKYKENQGLYTRERNCWACGNNWYICSYDIIIYNSNVVQLTDKIVKNGNYITFYKNNGSC